MVSSNYSSLNDGLRNLKKELELLEKAFDGVDLVLEIPKSVTCLLADTILCWLSK